MTRCPGAERLGRLLDGRDDDPGRDAVEDHIEGCAACREALERLTGGPDHPSLPRLAEAIRGLDRRVGVTPVEATRPEADGDPSSPGRGDGPPSPTAASRYVRVRPHERGGLGLVSVAVDTELDREVAFKEILPEQADRPQSRARFLLEAAVTARLEHPGIVPIYGQGVTDRGRPFYAMRFVRGESLKRAVERFHDRAVAGDPSARSLAFRDLLRRFIDVCNTIAYAHDRGVLHRDLKPSNILLGRFGETVVIDWGLAKLVGTGADDLAVDEPDGPLRPIARPAYETMVGDAIGSPSYMSPEQADGRSDSAGTACDIYGLGATLYTLLSGKPPREGGDVRRLLDAARSGAFPPPRAVNRDVPPALEAVCLKAMARTAGRPVPFGPRAGRGRRALAGGGARLRLSRAVAGTAAAPARPASHRGRRRRGGAGRGDLGRRLRRPRRPDPSGRAAEPGRGLGPHAGSGGDPSVAPDPRAIAARSALGRSPAGPSHGPPHARPQGQAPSGAGRGGERSRPGGLALRPAPRRRSRPAEGHLHRPRRPPRRPAPSPPEGPRGPRGRPRPALPRGLCPGPLRPSRERRDPGSLGTVRPPDRRRRPGGGVGESRPFRAAGADPEAPPAGPVPSTDESLPPPPGHAGLPAAVRRRQFPRGVRRPG